MTKLQGNIKGNKYTKRKIMKVARQRVHMAAKYTGKIQERRLPPEKFQHN